MKKAVLSAKTAGWATGLFLAMVTLMPALGQRTDRYRHPDQITPSAGPASILAELLPREYRTLSRTGAGDQTAATMQGTTVNGFLLELHNCRVQDTGSTSDGLARKNRLVQQYGLETGFALYSGNIWVGMTCKMVYESIGEPCKVIVHDRSSHVKVQWVYGFYSLCLCFEDQLLTSIQTY